MYIFISHSSKNADIAQELCNMIESNGSECFLAPRNIRSGFEYASEIIDGIDRSDVMLLILSKDANTSPHILREIERAVSKSIPIIVYKIENVELTKSMEYFLMTHQWLHAENGTHKQLLTCIDQLRAKKAYATAATSQYNQNIGNNDIPRNVNNNITNNVTTSKSPNKSLPIILGVATGLSIAVIVSLILILTTSGDKGVENNTTLSNNIAENTTDSSNEDTTENTTEDTTETPTKPPTSNADIELGDTIILGNYNNADIYWQVINISDDKTEAVLIAKNAISFKAFSGAASGNWGKDDDNNSYSSRDPEIYEDLNLQAYVRGDNSWDTSHIRAWLNSDKESVRYEGYGPIPNALCEHKNSYYAEPGFLSNFSDEELAAIKDTTVETKGNALREGTITTTDKVFLLSKDELKWLEEANVPKYVSPTLEAIDKNESLFYLSYIDVFHSEACFWWLRDPLEGSTSECYLVSHGAKAGEEFYNAIVAVEDFAIRPAITVDLTSDCIKVID